MYIFAVRPAGILLLTAVLNGCAFAPGMYVGKTNNGTVGQSSSWFSSKPDQTDDIPPAGRVITITPSLIREQRTSKPTDVSTDVKKLFDLAKPYQIGPNDVLNIVVWDHPELSVPPAGGLGTDAGSLSGIGNGFNVSPQGLIQFPYAGTIKLSGLTEYEARDLLTARLAKYIKDPQVTVRIQSYRSGRVYIDGEVRTPGLQALNDVPMTLPEAISRSGGITALGDRSAIAITRDGQTVVVNMPQLLQRNISPNNILLRNGDLVQVMGREEAKVFVMGEVLRPSTQTLRNGRLTLNEALGEAGGVSQTSGDPRQIFVVRAANTDLPEIYHLDAQSPTAFALAEGFELKARDVVYVDPVPLVRWNRVISLILPSATAVTTTNSSFKN
nr:polysaccharide biosynthesis/export family protein [uncultured Rhodoferax sp.]